MVYAEFSMTFGPLRIIYTTVSCLNSGYIVIYYSYILDYTFKGPKYGQLYY